MQHARFWMAAPILALSGATIWASGCGNFANDCINLMDPGCKTALGTTGGGGSTSTSTNTGGEGGRPPTSSSGTGGMQSGCLPTDPMFVSDKCGVFVALAGKADAVGTMMDPLPSLGAGIDAAVASNKYVFACADTFDEQVTIRNDVAIYGGREDCAKGWALKPDGATTVKGPDDKIALIIETSKYVTLEHIDVIAPNAVGSSVSSIAVLVDGGNAEFTNCKFTAGDGMKGNAGPVISPNAMLDGQPGTSGAALCDSGSHKGGVEQTATCSSGAVSISGRGGDGGAVGGATASIAGDGTAGTPSDASMMGKGGVGEGSAGAPACKVGDDGAKGAAGSDGQSTPAIGTLTKSGDIGIAGAAGGAGNPGQGGGGGGGSKGVKSTLVTCMMPLVDDYIGASGGSGGTGGCGGIGGAGGQAGGSSIALVSIGAQVTLSSVTLTPGKGGNGGKGGPGQSGGAQGPNGGGGAGSGTIVSGCNGGKGGVGGNGGPGAGGQGGHSLGVAYKGAAPKGMLAFPQTMPTPGAGGDAGAGAKDPKVGKGVAGNSTAPESYMLEFK